MRSSIHSYNKTTVVFLCQERIDPCGILRQHHRGIVSDPMKNRIREIREKNGWSQALLADRVGTSQAQVYKLENNQRRLSDFWMTKFASALGCTPIDLFAQHKKMVQIVGYVGAGQEIIPMDDESFEEIERPLGDDLPENIVAVRVSGDSMEPQLEDGWLIFYSREQDGVPPDCIGELCVVKLENEGILVKKLKQGSKPGLHHLFSKNTAFEPLFDQKLTWAARVLDIRPK